jgi:hypothetical protein
MLRDLSDWPEKDWFVIAALIKLLGSRSNTLPRDCAFFANQNDWNAINKAWVPPTDGCTELWWKKQSESNKECKIMPSSNSSNGSDHIFKISPLTCKI